MTKSMQRSCNVRSVNTSAERNAAVAAAAVNGLEQRPVVIDTTQKTLADLDGPQGYPILGTAPEYFRKNTKGKMHEVQVMCFMYFLYFIDQ